MLSVDAIYKIELNNYIGDQSDYAYLLSQAQSQVNVVGEGKSITRHIIITVFTAYKVSLITLSAALNQPLSINLIYWLSWRIVVSTTNNQLQYFSFVADINSVFGVNTGSVPALLMGERYEN